MRLIPVRCANAVKSLVFDRVNKLISMTTANHSKTSHLPRPGVGIGVFVTSQEHPQCVLIGKRKNSSGAGLWALPGGHLEFGESWEECGRREILEETGLKLKDVYFQRVINTVNVPAKYHYVTIFLKGVIDDSFKSEPENMEPHKCEGWHWKKWTAFPSNEDLYWSLRDIRAMGYDPFHKAAGQ